jgi:hypothetical protein
MATAENSLRMQEIVKLRAAGATYAAIGTQFGISKERVRQILAKHRRIAYSEATKLYAAQALCHYEAKTLMPLIAFLRQIAEDGYT